MNLRVLHVIAGLDMRAGGPTTAMSGLAIAQRDAGMKVTALATSKAGQSIDVAEELRRRGVPVTLLAPARGPLSAHPDLVPSLQKAIEATDVVHAHGLWEDIQHHAARIARQLDKPYVITAHGMLTRWSLDQKSFKKRLYLMWRGYKLLEHAAAIHYTSTTERDAQSARLKLHPHPIVEGLGVDLNEFESLPPKGTFRAKHPELAGKPIVMFLGRIFPGKGMEYLVPALAKMQNKEAMLVAVGPDGGMQPAIEQEIDRLGLRGRVLFTGMLRGPERIAALADADLFTLPSEHENFGLAVVEALACGVPVVISDGVAIADEIRDAQVGAVLPVGDVPVLATTLDQWLGHDSIRSNAADLARLFVWKTFDWRKVATRWADHYHRLIVKEADR